MTLHDGIKFRVQFRILIRLECGFTNEHGRAAVATGDFNSRRGYRQHIKRVTAWLTMGGK
ncbi:hypothetical protein K3A10_004276 [Escherichia albertii]|nr:hypothetical protein [Escherichia albertii]